MSASRDTQIAFTSWLTDDGMWTEGNSIRHEASLNVRASRWSLFKPHSPTPNARTSHAAPTRADLARVDRKRKKKGSNSDWTHPHDPDAKIAKMKDGRTHLAHKAEQCH